MREMKIDSSIKGLGQRGSVAGSRQTATSGKVPDSVGLQVELSTARLKQTGESFDAERVAEIRQAIAEGRFQINPERIADGLVDSVREMLSHRQRPA